MRSTLTMWRMPRPVADREIADGLKVMDLDPAHPATETIELLADAARTSVAERLPVFITG